jgi:two-component system OmpR family response regulator
LSESQATFTLFFIMRVLVVEDQAKIAAFTQKGLEESGFAVETCGDGNAAFVLATTQEFDAIVLDIMLPGRDGLSVLRGLRERHLDVPVILLTARNELNERLEGFNLGADDYLTKPFFVEELVVRLQALIRRSTGQAGNTLLQVGDLTLDLVRREALRAGLSIELSQREFSLLEYLMRSPGRVFSRSQISQHVWNTHFDTGTNMVDVAVARLRKKIDEGFETPLIDTVRGVGYRMRELPPQR